MKKISILILILGLVSFLSCKKEGTKATLSSSPSGSVLTLSGGSAVVLKKSDSAVPVVYTWTASSFGQTVVINYIVEMDIAGNNFKGAVPVGQVNNVLQCSINTYDLNQKILPMEYDPKNPVPIALEFRVAAIINPNVDTLYSVAVPQSITPYFVKIVYPILFVPGNYQGWNPADSTTIISSLKSNGQYEGYIWFGIDAAQFKYCQGNSWTTNWGDNAGNGTLQLNGSNIVAGAHGYYKLNVNLTALTHTFLRTAWSLLGDATAGGWNTDTDMTYDTIAKTWSATLDLTAAGIKFRANHDWTVNYGDDGTNTGKLSLNGANIAIPVAGNYTVILNLSQPVYKYKLTKN
jgi:hypothetical protein